MGKNVKKATTEESLYVSIPSIDLRTISVRIVGDSPLMIHKWSEKAKKELLDSYTKKAKTAKHTPKDPVAEFIDSLYWIEGEPTEKTEEGFLDAVKNGAKWGFPSVALKAAAVSAGYRLEILPNKVKANAAFHIDSALTEIHGIPTMQEDLVRVGMGRPDLRYRGVFTEWWMEFPVKYNVAAISAEQLVNLFNLGGFACGLGEWRIEKGGTYGAFHCE